MKDYLIKAYGFKDSVRIYTANTTNLVNKAQQIHDLWPTSAAAFGRLLTQSVIMGAMYKGDQELTIRIKSDGPLDGMLTIADAHGHVRGYVNNPHVFMQYDNGKLNVGQAVGNGFIHVTKDLKVRDTFTSSSPIQTGEIAEDFAYYFTASEQIPSAVGLGVLVNDDNSIIASGGFILQVMPGCKEDTLKEIENHLKTLKPVSEMIKAGFTPEDMMTAITGDDYKQLETLELSYECNCNKEKFEKGLISLGPDELQSILKEDKQIETVCHFCNTKYHFDENELETLIKNSNKKNKSD